MNKFDSFKDGKYLILRSHDNGRWHLSISHPNHYPPWDYIKKFRYQFLPWVKYAAIILPPLDEYVNVHPNCFQVWELVDYIPAEELYERKN